MLYLIQDGGGPMFDRPVKDVMRREKLLKAPPEMPVGKVAMLMASKSVGAVLSMSSSDAGVAPMSYGASDVAGAAKSVPIEPGQLDISANVIVVFELK